MSKEDGKKLDDVGFESSRSKAGTRNCCPFLCGTGLAAWATYFVPARGFLEKGGNV
jgi:hypothetical protein